MILGPDGKPARTSVLSSGRYLALLRDMAADQMKNELAICREFAIDELRASVLGKWPAVRVKGAAPGYTVKVRLPKRYRTENPA